jgi:hypothetical protein
VRGRWGCGRWWARRSLEEALHHARYEGCGGRRHFPVVAKGRRCRRDSFIPLLEEVIKSPSAVGPRDGFYRCACSSTVTLLHLQCHCLYLSMASYRSNSVRYSDPFSKIWPRVQPVMPCAVYSLCLCMPSSCFMVIFNEVDTRKYQRWFTSTDEFLPRPEFIPCRSESQRPHACGTKPAFRKLEE